jgi:phosphoglycerate dehydrogenase-like enzyme
MGALEARGVAVTNASGVRVPNIPEHAIGWMLTVARRLDEGWRRQQERQWEHFRAFGELAGSTATVVGLGAIGTGTVKRLEPFDVYIIGVRYTAGGCFDTSRRGPPRWSRINRSVRQYTRP